jgi:hypothetical protein
MARIPYATPGQCEELMHEVRLPVDAVPTNSLRMLAHAPGIGGAVLRLIHAILADAGRDSPGLGCSGLHAGAHC